VAAPAVVEDLEVFDMVLASSTRVRRRRRSSNSTCIRLQNDSMTALTPLLSRRASGGLAGGVGRGVAGTVIGEGAVVDLSGEEPLQFLGPSQAA
jgi:hypothetical protein